MTKNERHNSESFPEMAKWKNEVALVTGASSGIGWAVALALGRAGMRVAVTGRRKERLDELVDLLNESEAEGLAVPADFSREEDIAKVFEQIRSKWGGIRVLINNAGLGYQEELTRTSSKSLREMVEVNVLALTLCMQEAVKDMETAGLGQIINISSMAGHRVPGAPWWPSRYVFSDKTCSESSNRSDVGGTGSERESDQNRCDIPWDGRD